LSNCIYNAVIPVVIFPEIFSGDALASAMAARGIPQLATNGKQNVTKLVSNH